MSNLQKKPTTKVRSKVPCYCKKCNGKQVDPRTRQKHEKENQIQAAISSFTKKRKEEIRTSIYISESGNSSKSAFAASS